MSPQIKPIQLWGQGGANPPKVAMVLEELGLPYEIKPISFSDVKKPDYVAINPNGRLPAIYDPNTDITLWESGAILEYLVDHYDKDRRISFAPGTPESYHAKQWLFFQASGQGPYYGQAVWFIKFHHEPLPSVIERYCKEVRRVSAVLDKYLDQQKEKHIGNDIGTGPWLVGNKFSYVDIAFISWQIGIASTASKDQYCLDDFPRVKEWLGKMTTRPAVKRVNVEQAK